MSGLVRNALMTSGWNNASDTLAPRNLDSISTTSVAKNSGVLRIAADVSKFRLKSQDSPHSTSYASVRKTRSLPTFCTETLDKISFTNGDLIHGMNVIVVHNVAALINLEHVDPMNEMLVHANKNFVTLGS